MMSIELNPYLSFKDNARQAMEFYQQVFGGKLSINTFKDFQLSHGPEMDNLIMHSMLESDYGIKFMASDTPEDMDMKTGSTMSMLLSGEDSSKIEKYYEMLSEGGMVIQTLKKAAWGDIFGMVTDKFGITWMFNISRDSID